MPYTTEEGGRTNNFASEPKVYQAEPPSASEKRNLVIVAVVGAVLVTVAIGITVALS